MNRICYLCLLLVALPCLSTQGRARIAPLPKEVRFISRRQTDPSRTPAIPPATRVDGFDIASPQSRETTEADELSALALEAAVPVERTATTTPGPMNTEVQLTFSYESLTNGYAPWRSVSLDVTRKIADRKVVYASLSEISRFSLRDQQLLAGLYYPLGPHWTALIEGNVSPSHRVLPRFSLLGQLAHSLGKGWGTQLGVRHSEYNTARTDLGILTLEKYLDSYRLSYTLYTGHLQGAGLTASHLLSGDYYYAEGSSVRLGFSLGRELENVGARGILSTDIHGIFLVGRHWLTPRWALAYEAGWQKQGSLYIRKGVSIGLRYRF